MREYGTGIACHICGLPIPSDIVSANHPLFGTIDHILPKCAGGTDKAANRAPAHRWCNQRKSDRVEYADVADECRVMVAVKLLGHINCRPSAENGISRKNIEGILWLITGKIATTELAWLIDLRDCANRNIEATAVGGA
jgi:hypothetical protein